MMQSPDIAPVDAPSLVLLPLTGTCSLNQSPGYALGRRHPSAATILRDHRIHWYNIRSSAG